MNPIVSMQQESCGYHASVMIISTNVVKVPQELTEKNLLERIDS